MSTYSDWIERDFQKNSKQLKFIRLIFFLILAILGHFWPVVALLSMAKAVNEYI